MRTESSSPTTARASSKLIWAGVGVLALTLTAFTLSMPAAQGSDHATAIPAKAPPDVEVNRIDHSLIDLDKYPVEPDPSSGSVAGYPL